MLERWRDKWNEAMKTSYWLMVSSLEHRDKREFLGRLKKEFFPKLSFSLFKIFPFFSSFNKSKWMKWNSTAGPANWKSEPLTYTPLFYGRWIYDGLLFFVWWLFGLGVMQFMNDIHKERLAAVCIKILWKLAFFICTVFVPHQFAIYFKFVYILSVLSTLFYFPFFL